ncbi:uncharacterized protein LOC132261755 isoform X2 [Phlebotomus argentipes]|uniref:uncharacterized protein LOC132261755 isoform X2 n=1 Tax=Phlebotomus argentipes TaxID=94469 RepID=UPI00289371F1|nr:uncharacterized protein LOC132261755 isoform X2 [Phlebotomus argentipes]
MPYYSDLSFYYGAGPPLINPYINPPPYASFAGYTRALTGGYAPILPPRTTYSSSRYTPILSTISEAPYASSRRPTGLSSLTRINSPKLSMHISPKYTAPRPIPINTADIDVSASRYNRNSIKKNIIYGSDSASSAAKDRAEAAQNTDQSPFMPRCDQDDNSEIKKPIKRDRTVVRISTMRAKSGRKSPKIAKEETQKPRLAEVPPATPTDPPIKKTWRDNFGDELSPKPKEPPKKSPGERLLERHLIKHERQDKSPPRLPAAQAADFFTFDCIPQGARLEERRPSFHDICQDISSDKLESVDDLNAGELRRKASLIREQEEVIAVNKVTKSASGTLHCILERHLDDNHESKHKNKKIKHKITCSVGVDEPKLTDSVKPRIVQAEEEAQEVENSTPIKVKKKLTAVVEHIEDHVVKLPKKKTKKPVEKKAEPQEDIWSGMRETVYCNKRQQEIKERRVEMLKAFQEEAEQSQMAEIIPREAPQPVIVEKRSLTIESEEKSASILAPVDRGENSVKVSKPSQSESSTDAKVHSSPNNGAVDAGWESEIEAAAKARGASASKKGKTLPKNRDNAQTVTSVDTVKIKQEKECEKLTMRAPLKIPNGPAAKSPEPSSQPSRDHTKSTDRAERNSTRDVPGGASPGQRPAAKAERRASAKSAGESAAAGNEEVPRENCAASPAAEANTSEDVTPTGEARCASMANAASARESTLNDHEEITTCKDKEVNIFKSHSGKISKFPTFSNLNELSLDHDQSEKSMAIEVDGARNCLGAAKPVEVPSVSAKESDTGPKSDEKGEKAADMPPESPQVNGSEKPPVKVVKKKIIIVKKVVKKNGVVVTKRIEGKKEPEVEPEAEPVEEVKPQEKKGHRKKTAEKKGGFNPQKCMKFSPEHNKKKLFTVDEKATKVLYATPRPLQKKKKQLDYYSSDESDLSSGSDSDDSSPSSSSGDEFFDCPSPPDHKLNLYASKDVRMSTCSNDSGFEGGTAPSSPKQMLETSYTYAQFQRSGRITAPATSIPRFRKYAVEDFHFLAVLGKGSFGKVLLAELRNTEFYYAVKCLKKDVVLEDDDVECTLIERKVLALGTKHPYLCHLFCTFQTESHLFFVMEYLNGGDLMFHIQQSGRFPEVRARFYAAEIISGLKFLHKKGIIYRDLKLDNVLLDFDGHVRIADFGMCKLQIYLDRTADSFCGTPDYMAPEIIKGQKYNQAVDWWSFGVLLYEMLIGQSPFSGCDEDELFWSICNEVPWIPGYISKEANNILKALLEKDASIRLGSNFCPMGDITYHQFFFQINWDRLEKRELEPPFKPQVRHPLDTQYFDKTFTKERVRLTPIDKEILQSMAQDQFQGFSYTNPNATLN